MSILDVEYKRCDASRQDHMIDLPNSIHEKLKTVIRQSWRAELVERVSAAAAVAMLAIIGLVVADVLFGLRWTPMRWAIWGAGFGTTVGAIRYCLVKPRQHGEQLLDAAWKIESSHPSMEERLTSTVQFLSDDSRQDLSPQLINALVTETTESVDRIDPEDIPSRSSRIPVTVAVVLATALVVSVVIWPNTVLTSLGNLATPWSSYSVPTLSAEIVPGDVTIAEGESIRIEVIASKALENPTLEVIRGDVVESHAMLAASTKLSTFTLADVRHDAVYRICSGGLYSVPHTITVHPQPRLKAIAGHLEFPDYTHLDPLTIEQVLEPIVVPAGTEVTLRAMSDNVAVGGTIRWKSEPHEVIARKVTARGSVDLVQFEWMVQVEPQTDCVGTLEVRSEHGVASTPRPIAIRALADSPPTIEIISPTLRQLTLGREGDLPIRYRVLDDFGVSREDLMVKFGEQEPIALACTETEAQPGDQRAWRATSLSLADAPAGCHEVSLWLRIADNRPDEFGGAQVINSEQIHVTLDDHAGSLGQQQISADRQTIEKSLQEAMEQMQQALAAAEALQNPGLKVDPPNARAAHIDALRRQTMKAKQTLVQLADKLENESNLFQPQAAEIQQVADQEVTEALELANQIPLTDDQPQQNELARGSQQRLDSAVDQLEQLKSNILRQAEQLEQAAQLDQLASKQERLARKAAAGDQNDAPDEPWRDRQEEVADELQTLVEDNGDGLQDREQLLQQADQADRLAKQAQKLARQQQQLEQAMREAQPNEGKPEEARRQLQNLIETQKDELNQQARPAGQRQVVEAERAGKEAKEGQKQRLDEAAKAAQEGDLDAAAAKVQEQIADRAEEIQEQAEQLAEQNNLEPSIQESARQAAEQLQQARQKADQAQQSLCEKCNGGGQGRSDAQSKPGAQDKPGAQAPPFDEQNQRAEPQIQKQPQGLAAPKDAAQQEPAPETVNAEINRDQQEAVRSLQEASQSLGQVCKSCRECAKRNESGSSSGSQRGNSQRGRAPSRAKQFAKAVDDAKQAAQSRTNEQAAQQADSVAEQLNQLADEAAQNSGYSLRQQKSTPTEQGKQHGKQQSKQQGTDNQPDDAAGGGPPGQPSADPKGVGTAASDTSVHGAKLRGGANSNWTRSRRRLDGGVLDDREGNVPEQYRGVVKRYFEELSRQQSSRGR